MREDGGEAYQMLCESIEESPVLYVFIDGELLCQEDKELAIKTLSRKVRTINTFLMEYAGNAPDCFRDYKS